MKNHIITVKFQHVEKRLWFVTEQLADPDLRFAEACGALDAVGDQCSDWLGFLDSVLKHFAVHGFIRIKP